MRDRRFQPPAGSAPALHQARMRSVHVRPEEGQDRPGAGQEHAAILPSFPHVRHGTKTEVHVEKSGHRQLQLLQFLSLIAVGGHPNAVVAGRQKRKKIKAKGAGEGGAGGIGRQAQVGYPCVGNRVAVLQVNHLSGDQTLRRLRLPNCSEKEEGQKTETRSLKIKTRIKPEINSLCHKYHLSLPSAGRNANIRTRNGGTHL